MLCISVLVYGYLTALTYIVLFQKEETERKAREEAERVEKERQERIKKEEEERLERRKVRKISDK